MIEEESKLLSGRTPGSSPVKLDPVYAGRTANGLRAAKNAAPSPVKLAPVFAGRTVNDQAGRAVSGPKSWAYDRSKPLSARI
jgi:hypothetical protein